MADTPTSIIVDIRPALSLVRRILESPSGADHAPHLLAMIRDDNLVEIAPACDGLSLRAVPSIELVRVACAAGVIEQ